MKNISKIPGAVTTIDAGYRVEIRCLPHWASGATVVRDPQTGRWEIVAVYPKLKKWQAAEAVT